VSSAQAELDAMDELQRASNQQAAVLTADERAMMEMQAAIDAERSERAAREASPDPDPVPSRESSPHGAEPLNLVLFSSSLSEFRDSGGRVQAFHLNARQASFGTLCAALSQMPGVSFPDHVGKAWFRRPSRFIYRDTPYEVGVSNGNYSVVPAKPGPAIPEMEEILEYVRAHVLKSVKSRFVTEHRIG